MNTKEKNGSADRYSQQNSMLFDLAVTQRKNPVNFIEHARLVLKRSAQFLDVQKASLWEFRKGRTELECLCLYDLGTDTFSDSLVLLSKDYPAYFKACKSERIIDADDAYNDVRTKEFSENYLPQFGITSMLDGPIFLGSDPKGILCFEHVGPKRKWSEEDLALAASLADIFALSIAERDKNEARELIVSGFNTVAQGILICDSKGQLMRANKKAAKTFGFTEAQMYFHNINELIPGCLEAEGVVAGVISGTRSQDHLIEDQVAVHRTGENFPIEYSIAKLSHWRGPCALIIFTDISERRIKEQLVERNELLYRSVVEDMMDFIIRVAPGGKLRFANQSVCDFFELDRENFEQYNVLDFVPESEMEVVRNALSKVNEDNPVVSYSHKALYPGDKIGRVSWTMRAFFNDGELSGWQGVGRDITDEERRQQRERESQRMESLAVLAGGMAHDFNNLLTPILCYTDLTQVMVPQDSEEYKNLAQVMQAATRAKELTRMVLIFSKHDERGQRESIFASRYIQEILNFIKSTSSARIRFLDNLDSDCGVIRANPSDLYQILANLCTNACQAMPAGGDLTISCSLVQHHKRQQLQIEVRDTGSGVSEEQMQYIFDPFFTTKPVGQGTGLGLSVVKSIVEELDGEIDCYSASGNGTSFVIYLPTQESLPDLVDQNSYTAVLEGSETVLVVDDDLKVATAIRDVLERLGYQVVMRTSANEAINTFNQDPDKFDILVTDYTMPYMTGLELCWELHRLRADLPVIMMSGYEKVLSDEEVELAGLTAVIDKPFVIEEIATLIRVVLKKSPA